MIKGIGIDLIEVERIQNAILKYGERFLNRVYTETEVQYCESFNDTKFVHYAARFAVKEAFSKAIGTGLSSGFRLNCIGIKNENNGLPKVELFGYLKDKYSSCNIIVSLSHIKNFAVAVVLLEE